MISQEGEGAAFTKPCTFLEAAYHPNLLEAKTSLSESNNASQLSRADDSLDDVRMNRTTLFLISIGTPLLCTVETTAARDLSSTHNSVPLVKPLGLSVKGAISEKNCAKVDVFSRLRLKCRDHIIRQIFALGS